MRTVQVVVYSAIGIPALGILVSGIGFIATRVGGDVRLNVVFGRVLVASLYAAVVGAALALAAGLLLSALRKDPS